MKLQLTTCQARNTHVVTAAIAAYLAEHGARLLLIGRTGIHADPGTFLRLLGARWGGQQSWPDWLAQLKALQAERDEDIATRAKAETEFVNPVQLCEMLETQIAEDSIIIGDGGDFVATASYIIRPRAPLTWQWARSAPHCLQPGWYPFGNGK